MLELKKMIQAMVNSNADKPMTVAQLNRDFKTFEGRNIPYQQYGYTHLDAMLRAMSDGVKLQGQGPNALVLPLTTEKSQHIRQMVVKQKRKHRISNQTSARNPTKNLRTYSSNSHSIYRIPEFAHRNDVILDSLYEDNVSSSDQECLYIHNDRSSESIPSAQPSYHIADTSNVERSDSSSSRREMNVRYGNKSVPQIHRNPVVLKSAEGPMPVELPTIPLSAMTLTDRLLEHRLPPDVKAGCMFKAVVISVLSPTHIYVQLTCHIEKLVQIAGQLETMYTSMDRHNDADWQVPEVLAQEGLHCIVIYQDIWYRARIDGPVVGQYVDVYLVDYERKVPVALSDVWYMRKKDAFLPPQTMRVSLAHVQSVEGGWKAEATRVLNEAICNKAFYMYVVCLSVQEDVPEVVFIDTTTPTNVLVNNELVLAKQARWLHGN